MPSGTPTISVGRRSQGTLYRPSQLDDSPVQCRLVDCKTTAPSTKGEGLALIGQATGSASVPTLFFDGSPTDIPRFIVAHVVNAVDAMLGRRASTHVSQKGLERPAPFGANCYPAAAIVGVVLLAGILAAVQHRRPNPIFGHPSYGVRLPHAGDINA